MFANRWEKSSVTDAKCAHRVLAYLSAFFNWAVRRDVVEANPASNVARAVKEVGRERFLSEEEIKLF
jgi:site-specific recombinase XerD